MWTQERLQKGEFLLKAVSTDENVADLMAKHLAAARAEELLSRLGVQRCARRLVVTPLIARVETDHSSCLSWGAWFWCSHCLLGILLLAFVLS